jgi:DNA-binding transcriptional LysR family regulator
MNQIHIKSLDLNLLKVLEALLEEGGVTAAGRRLGLTQSAVSHALNRLRHRIGDPLFVRTATGMSPTPRAVAIGAEVREALAALAAALEPVRFTPAQTQRAFALSASGYACAVLLPRVLARLRVEAPFAELDVIAPGAGSVEALDQGRIELAIGGFGETPDRYGKAGLFHDEMVWVLRAGHPAAGEPLTLERLAGLSVLQVSTGENRRGGETLIDHGLERRISIGGGEALRAALAERGLSLKIAARVPDGQTALSLIARTEMAALLPRRMVEPFKRALALFEPPHPVAGLELSMIWRKDRDNPGSAWFRGVVAEAAAELP